jgi:hypothetical protein
MVVVGLLLSGAQAVGAQARPAIVTFESSLKTITLAEAEAGETTTTLMWHTVGMGSQYRLALHEYILNDWHLVFAPDSVPLESSGARVVTARHSLSFGPPTYLLSILDTASNGIVDQRTLTIPYDPSSVAGAPTIDEFSTDTESVDQASLKDPTAQVRIGVSWGVSNRVPTSLLVFEQEVAKGDYVSVELPRLNLWVPSAGTGAVAPVYVEGVDQVTLRLRLVDVVSDEVYDEATLDVLIAGIGGPTDEGGGTGEGSSEQPPAGNIVSFSATPAATTPGAAVTLAWEVRGTGGVTIEQSVPNVTAAPVVISAQSPKGTAQVFLPAYAMYGVTYTLKTADGTESAQTQVAVQCPNTFFFGPGDGCPAAPAQQVGAVFQQFEGGYMLWRQDTNEIYVHYQEGAIDHGAARYFVSADYAALPNVAVDDMPPLDRQAPTQGFAKVWANAPGVREKLGWATAGETGYTANVQAVALTREPRPLYAFYVSLPDGGVVGSGFGSWRTVP